MFDQRIALLLSVNPRVQQGTGWHMHDGGYMFGNSWSWGASLLHTVLWLAVLAGIVVSTLLLARRLGAGQSGGDQGKSAIDRLDQRYASGEIEREEYLQRKSDILNR